MKTSAVNTATSVQTQKGISPHTQEPAKRTDYISVRAISSKSPRNDEDVQRLLAERAARIEELRARVSAGTYKVDTLTLAQRIQEDPVIQVILEMDTAESPRK